MSVRLLGRAFYADLPAHLKLLLLALCDEASEDGRGISIGQAKLAVKVGATDRTVRSNLNELEHLGWIVKHGRDPKYRTTRHEIVVDRLPHGPEDVSGQEEPEVQRQTDRKSSVSDTGSPLPPTQELPVTATRDQELPTPRKRNVIADALALAEGSDPLEVPASRMRTLCVKAAELRKLAPEAPPEDMAAEVAVRASRWPEHFPGATITGPAVVTHWARLARPGSGNGRPQTATERAIARAAANPATKELLS